MAWRRVRPKALKGSLHGDDRFYLWFSGATSRHGVRERTEKVLNHFSAEIAHRW